MKPNVILINCDDLGYGDLNCYNETSNATPHIDYMVKHGKTFTSAYAPSSICTPSRAGLMTACYPPRVGLNKILFPGEEFGLSTDEYTIPKLFAENNYKTMIIGKWHLGDQKEFSPKQFGFEHYFGIPFSNGMGMRTQKRKTGKSLPPLPLVEDDEVIEEQPDQCSLTERYTEKAVRFIRKNKDNNFFLYLAHMHVHLPLYAAERFIKESKNGTYGACVSEVDWSTGVIFYELKKLGLEENTLIIFTSDNGSTGDHGASNLPLNGFKRESLEGGFRIPFIAMWKGKILENSSCDEIISHIDLLPTLANIIGADLKIDKKTDGQDLSETIFENKKIRDEFAYFSTRTEDGTSGFANLDAVRKGDWKLRLYKEVVNYKDCAPTFELYNLKEDIGEKVNLYDSRPDKVAELKIIYDKYEKDLGHYDKKIIGKNVRKCGEVENPVPLTVYEESNPYMIALYDSVGI